jgi:hypothetical protein
MLVSLPGRGVFACQGGGWLVKFCSLKYRHSDNLGDEIQSLAAEQYLPRLEGFVDRDDGLRSVAEPTFVFLNGWFKHGPTHWRLGAAECWPPSHQVRPAFIGFHIAFSDLLTEECFRYYRRWAPIGCRDIGTMNMLKENGVEAYFSRCLTLTFPPRKDAPADARTFIVEGRRPIDRSVIPDEIAREAEYRNHYVAAQDKTNNAAKRNKSKSLLDEYRSGAKLVVTNLLHCALPCVAMRIPTVFITAPDPLYPTDYRLDPIRDIIPIYHAEDEIDWNPKPPDVSALAEEIRGRAMALIP